MKPFSFFVVLWALLCAGCSVLNLFETGADYERKHFAADMKEGIDRAIQEELRKQTPSGQPEPYSEELWKRIWSERIHALRTKGFFELKHYRGPNGNWFVDYIISERRKFALPELGMEEPEKHSTPSTSTPTSDVAHTDTSQNEP